EPLYGGLNDHLESKLHARRIQLERENLFSAEAAQSTIKIIERDIEKSFSKKRQQRITDKAVKCRHRTWSDSTQETIADNEIVSVLEFGHEPVEFEEVITVIAVTHDDVLAAGHFYPGAKRVPIAPGRDRDDRSSERFGDARGT